MEIQGLDSCLSSRSLLCGGDVYEGCLVGGTSEGAVERAEVISACGTGRDDILGLVEIISKDFELV